MKADNGVITAADLQGLLAGDVLDQYGVKNADKSDCIITVSNVVENPDGLYTSGVTSRGSITINQNGTKGANIADAERGDTFTVIFTYSNTIRVSVNVTVGSDKKARSYDTNRSAWE